MDHRCRRGRFCANREEVDGVIVGRAIPAEYGFCDTCARHVEQAVQALPQDYVQLNAILGGGSTVGGEPVRMTKDLPVPIRLHIEALQRSMVEEADAWAGSLARVLNVDWHPHGGTRPGWRLTRACRLIGNSLSAFLALRDEKHIIWEYGHRYVAPRDGLDGALNFLSLSYKARLFLGQTKLVHHLPVPCPRCDAMDLVREDGSELIECRDCNRTYSWTEYERLCLILVDREEKGLNVA
ncbi:hypothetical protein [Amycolatopsis sp. NPDC021455]|uniref:hypothetical protein n=1 Tax=Amycolatopsis sp. NPDC021455 TaxID=3154901 RepID=UPI00340FC851